MVEEIGCGHETVSGHIPFTPRAKKVLQLSLREALAMGHNYIGTKHMLVAIERQQDGVAAQILVRCGVEAGRARQTIVRMLSPAC